MTPQGPVGTVAQVSLREATEVLGGGGFSGSLGPFPGLRCIFRDGGPALQNHGGETKWRLVTPVNASWKGWGSLLEGLGKSPFRLTH